MVSEGLSDKLVCILWQFTPSFVFNENNLNKVLAVLNSNFQNVVEFWHGSWWNKIVFEKLQIIQAVFCKPNYHGLPKYVLQNNRCGYFRQQGLPKLFYSEYSPDEIETLYNHILAKDFSEVYVYFNNTASPAAVNNALQFLKLKY